MSEPAVAYVNTDAEKSVLSAAMQSKQCLKLVSDIPPDEFYDKRNRIIHYAICRMSADGQPVDLLTLSTFIGNAKQMDAVGGIAYLTEVYTFTVTIVNIQAYVRIMHECAARRTLYTIGKSLMERSGSTESPDEVREWAARTIKDVRISNQVKVISMMDACMATYASLEAGQESEDGGVSKRITS